MGVETWNSTVLEVPWRDPQDFFQQQFWEGLGLRTYDSLALTQQPPSRGAAPQGVQEFRPVGHHGIVGELAAVYVSYSV